MEPLYLITDNNTLKEKSDRLKKTLESCNLCGWSCGINRYNEKGLCGENHRIKISSVFPHFGEEGPLVGTNGSGTIFFTGCSCKCIFCQNWTISQKGEGSIITDSELTESMMRLQSRGCHNINLVTPTHFIPQIVDSIIKAKELGLNIPVVYNTGGYDNPETIKLLDGIVDIYMPDIKYGSNENAEKYSGIPLYWDIASKSLKIMHSQVGDLKVNQHGIAERGLLIRHLVLPAGLAESEKVLKFIAEEISVDSYINIMSQYRPCYRAEDFKELNRRISIKEYRTVVDMAESIGFYRGFK